MIWIWTVYISYKYIIFMIYFYHPWEFIIQLIRFMSCHESWFMNYTQKKKEPIIRIMSYFSNSTLLLRVFSCFDALKFKPLNGPEQNFRKILACRVFRSTRLIWYLFFSIQGLAFGNPIVFLYNVHNVSCLQSTVIIIIRGCQIQ